MLTNAQFTCLAEKYMDMVFRVAFNYLRSGVDADDVTQNTGWQALVRYRFL